MRFIAPSMMGQLGLASSAKSLPILKLQRVVAVDNRLLVRRFAGCRRVMDQLRPEVGLDPRGLGSELLIYRSALVFATPMLLDEQSSKEVVVAVFCRIIGDFGRNLLVREP
jgi:hypothetical protein